MLINPFEPAVLFLKSVCFTCSPVDAARYKREQKARDAKLKAQSSQDFDSLIGSNKESVWKTVINLVTLTGLIHRQHLCGYTFSIFSSLHMLFLLHAAIKTSVYFYLATSREQMRVLEDYFYPHPLGGIRNTHIFNTFIMEVSWFCLIARCERVLSLSLQAARNQYQYERLELCQLNLSYMTLFYATPSEWMRFIKSALSHGRKKKIANSSEIYGCELAHSRIADIELDQVAEHGIVDSMAALTTPNFDDCYAKLGFKFDLTTRQKYQNWFYPENPTHRIDAYWLAVSAITSLIMTISSVILPILFEVLQMTLEADELFGPITEHFFETINQGLYYYASKPRRAWKFIESILLCVTMCAVNADALFLSLSILIIATRVRKLTKALEFELAKFETDSQLRRATLAHLYHEKRSFIRRPKLVDQDERSELILRLNKRLCRLAAVSGILRNEFQSLKRTHTSYMNILFIGSGLCISHAMATASEGRVLWESILLRFIFTCIHGPTVVALVASAFLERQFERQEDRTIMVLGKYPATLDVLGPFFTGVATLVFLINRLQTQCTNLAMPSPELFGSTVGP